MAFTGNRTRFDARVEDLRFDVSFKFKTRVRRIVHVVGANSDILVTEVGLIAVLQ